MKQWLTVILICSAAVFCPSLVQGQTNSGLSTSPLAIETEEGKVDFVVELAVTPSQKMQGLMFRRSLPAGAGMLFDYGRSQRVSMWMKNTYIPLDILFIDPDGQIVTIAERTVPHSLKSIPSGQPVRAVLEINGGTVARHGIKTGDRVVHEIFDGTGD